MEKIKFSELVKVMKENKQVHIAMSKNNVNFLLGQFKKHGIVINEMFNKADSNCFYSNNFGQLISADRLLDNEIIIGFENIDFEETGLQSH
jgi:hypothetical protein